LDLKILTPYFQKVRENKERGEHGEEQEREGRECQWREGGNSEGGMFNNAGTFTVIIQDGIFFDVNSLPQDEIEDSQRLQRLQDFVANQIIF
jgi:hypothetical protein